MKSPEQFETFFKSNYKPIPSVDRNTNALLEDAARKGFAACWNAAIEAAVSAAAGVNDPVCQHAERIRDLKVLP